MCTFSLSIPSPTLAPDWAESRAGGAFPEGSFRDRSAAPFPRPTQCHPMRAVVTSPTPVTLLGGADLAPEDLNMALPIAPAVVCADGGARHALAHGLDPLAVIGDMDSLPPEAAAAFADRLHPVAEQDTTDLDKALGRVEAPLVLALGVLGGRLDHELAALHALALHPHRPCLLLGAESLCALCPPRLALDAPGLVSLFPLGPVSARSSGLRWPLDGLALDPLGRIGTSNAAAGPWSVEPAAPRLLVILPRQGLPLLARALLLAPRWPAPARRPRAPSPR